MFVHERCWNERHVGLKAYNHESNAYIPALVDMTSNVGGYAVASGLSVGIGNVFICKFRIIVSTLSRLGHDRTYTQLPVVGDGR